MKKSSYFVKGLLSIGLTGAMMFAYAETNGQNEISVKSSIQVQQNANNNIAHENMATITLQEAALIAKKNSDGKIVSVNLEDINGNLVYTADVLKHNQITNLIIDAGNGRILSSRVESTDKEVSDNSKDEDNNDNQGQNESDHESND